VLVYFHIILHEKLKIYKHPKEKMCLFNAKAIT
jgi:hypothetical protein